MLECLTEAIILDKEAAGEADFKVILYTKELGKITAKATSARKITSKLNAHLEPLNISLVRLVHKNNFQIIDALSQRRLIPEKLPLLRFIKDLTYEGQSDYDLWLLLKEQLNSPQTNYSIFLKILGFDPQFAACHKCHEKPLFFSTDDLSFWCRDCLSDNFQLSTYNLQ